MVSEKTFPYTHQITTISVEDYHFLVEKSLQEDAPAGDVTSLAFLTETTAPQEITATLVAKENGILCGLDVFLYVFRGICSEISCSVDKKDGQPLQNLDIVCRLKGSAAAMLRAERPALNFLGLLSGIASKTRSLVQLLRKAEMSYFKCTRESELPKKIQVLDTRKTIPGYRKLSKYAVTTGGGMNHRLDLSEMGMIKDNHIAASGNVRLAVERFTSRYPSLPFEVEADTYAQVEEIVALAHPPDAILLDNMDRELLKKCCRIIPGNILIEASGNYSESNVHELVGTGCDGVSLGTITKAPWHLDFSLEFKYE